MEKCKVAYKLAAQNSGQPSLLYTKFPEKSMNPLFPEPCFITRYLDKKSLWHATIVYKGTR